MTHKRVLRSLFGPDAATQPFRVRIALCLITTLAYVLAFAPAYGLMSRSAIALSILPIIVTAARFGSRGGVVAGLGSVPLNALLFVLVGERDIGPFSGRNFLFSHIVFIAIGAVVGYLYDVRKQLQRELHDRKLAENRLRELNTALDDLVTARSAEIFTEKERSDTILRSAADAIAMFDLEMKPSYVNPAFAAMTGYTVEELRQGNVNFLARPEQNLHPQLSVIVKGEVWQDEVTILRKDGRTYDAAMTVAPVRDAGDKVVGLVSSHQDISRLKELERARNRFVTNVSHALRTPVTTIKLYGHLLGLGHGPEKTAIYLEALKKQAEQLEHLIQDILEIAVLDAGKATITWEPLWLFSVVDNVVTRCRAQADVAGLGLATLPVSPELPEVKGDYGRLSQALGELVDNAILFTPTGGQVTLGVGVAEADERRWVTVSVRDTGPGIPLEEQEQVFDRFFRGRLAESGHVPGTGLGLSIAQEILRIHGGRLTMESQAEEGCTFQMWLPVDRPTHS